MDVLLVEDEPLVRDTVVEILRDAGFTVAAAGSAEEALTAAESCTDGPPPVVVVDLHLGSGMDGLALGAEALRRWPGVGVVYATGYPGDFTGRLLGPQERYVVKPFKPTVLLHAVRRLMPTRGVVAWIRPVAL
jgi:CheY-like chemotaxis protein